MFYLEQTRATPEENLAFDEALLELSERHAPDLFSSVAEAAAPAEVLRLWEMRQTCVVVGRSSRLIEEVHLQRCAEDGVPVLRRMSGGAAIVAGPGCLMYSVLLSLDRRPECRNLDQAHRTVMETNRAALVEALQRHGVPDSIDIRGICDLTHGSQKISGNSLRVKKHFLLYHGTILIDMPLEWIGRYLASPPKQPEYRAGRSHDAFVTGLGQILDQPVRFTATLKQCLIEAWQAKRPWSKHSLASGLDCEIADWLEKRYSDPTWHAAR